MLSNKDYWASNEVPQRITPALEWKEVPEKQRKQAGSLLQAAFPNTRINKKNLHKHKQHLVTEKQCNVYTIFPERKHARRNYMYQISHITKCSQGEHSKPLVELEGTV